MMEVQKYLHEHGLQKLQDEFYITVNDYEDRIVLNYDQIDSPRFNPICDECRALILRKSDFSVMARSFDRFYNVGEGEAWKDYPISEAKFQEKRDGSLLSLYNDGEKWCVSTRKMAYAEGKVPIGITFRQLFDKAAEGTNLWNWLDSPAIMASAIDISHLTFVFELTSPENRVVTPYSNRKITLIGSRNNRTGDEAGHKALDLIAKEMDVSRPKSYEFSSWDEITSAAESLGAMEEGFVLVVETGNGSHSRLKCKNPKFVAIAHMRDNGGISPKRILTLVMVNEQEEYLGYFKCDKPYFDFVQAQFENFIENTKHVLEQTKHIDSQKEFALTIQKLTKYKASNAILFKCRKNNTSVESEVRLLGSKKLAEQLDLNSKFASTFDSYSDPHAIA